jgi:hypothetical protein
LPAVHDFAVIWDEDHDTRVIDAIEHIYMSDLMAPVQFIGERKGTLTIILAAKFYFMNGEPDAYKRRIDEIARYFGQGDSWTVEIGSFDRRPGSPAQTYVRGIIAADDHRVTTYLRNIDSLWGLGTRPFVRNSPTQPLHELPEQF